VADFLTSTYKEIPGMKRKLMTFVLLGFLLVFCVACTATNIKHGYIRDTIGNIEQTNNGNWRVWFTHDTAAGYCTGSQEMGKRAEELLLTHYGEVILEYKEVTASDKEWSVWGSSQCGSLVKGESSMKMFLILAITPAPARVGGE